MTCRVIAVCDLCRQRVELKDDGPMDEVTYEKELGYLGWWRRNDGIRDVCPNHPNPLELT